MEDVAPKLLEILQAAFHNKFDENEVVAELAKKLASEEADYKDANAFAVEIGKILAGVYQENLSSNVLPDGRMYYNIAKRIIEPTMKENYELVSAFSQDVQTALNHKARIGIKGIKAPLKEDKIRGIVERLAEEEDFDAAKWLLDEPVVTFTQSVVNDTIEENTKFAYKAGLKPKIVRTEVGSCCDWCKEVAGTYEYPKVPKDVYRRHNRCRCTVEYFPGNGKKQDVYSKKWVDIEKDEKIDERIKLTTESGDVKNNFAQATYGEVHGKEISNIAKNADQSTKGVYLKYQDRLKTSDPNYRGKSAYYSPESEDVTLNIEEASKGDLISTPYQTYFHEYGHMIDHLSNSATDSLKASSETYIGSNGKTLGKTAIHELKTKIKQIKKRKATKRNLKLLMII